MKLFIYIVLVTIALSCYLITSAKTTNKKETTKFQKPSIVLAYICRNEANNFKANLDDWAKIVSRFTFSMDSRNTDDSVDVIERILDKYKHIKYQIVVNNFEGFGQARSHSLANAWKFYGNETTHVLIGDPDWKPHLNTFKIAELDISDPNIIIYRFQALDGAGSFSRQMDWMIRHMPGIRMKYTVHELLDIENMDDLKIHNVRSISFIVQEVKNDGTWHAQVGHGTSSSYKRKLFDLSLLAKDYKTYGDSDPRIHYYIGTYVCLRVCLCVCMYLCICIV